MKVNVGPIADERLSSEQNFQVGSILPVSSRTRVAVGTEECECRRAANLMKSGAGRRASANIAVTLYTQVASFQPTKFSSNGSEAAKTGLGRVS